MRLRDRDELLPDCGSRCLAKQMKLRCKSGDYPRGPSTLQESASGELKDDKQLGYGFS